jgi:branched-chain amino acid transport system ATP-binding protein
VVDAYLGAHHDQALEFDEEGNPVGETAALVAEMVAVEVGEASDLGGGAHEPAPSGTARSDVSGQERDR